MTVKQTQPTVKQQADMYVMIGKQMASSYPWWAMLIAFVVGLVIGWMVLGWLIWPVQWSQAKPASLSNDPANQREYMQSYLNFAATTYGTGSMSIEQVAQFLGEGWTVQDITAVLDQMIATNYASNTAYLEKFKNDLNVAVQTGAAQIGPPNATTNQPGISSALALALAIVAIVLAILFGIWLFLRLRSDKPEVTVVSAPTTTTVEAGPVVVPAVSRAAGGARPVEKTAWPGETRAPLTQFATTYAFGDDRYDMSSSIETSDGDFLGECGVGISESLGGTPEKITALEVWVFDKNDVRTVTKVLMSDHAFNDSALRAKLAPKGDAVLAQPGEVVELKTQTLKINARIVDVVYGGGTPANSYFQQVTLELATWSDSQ
jgi:heme/copper-type cytochrome/quinol oxidase subunit 2